MRGLTFSRRKFVSSNITLPKKILINNAFYILPIAVLLYLMYNGFSKDIVFAEKEVIGADINKKAISLLQNVVDGDTATDSAKKDVQDILEKRKKYVDDLNFEPAAMKAKGKESLFDDAFQKTIKSIGDAKADSAAIMATLNDLVSYVGDSSNLILDPDLDTYYLMDGTIYAVPQLINRLNDVNSFLKENASHLGTLSAKETIKLSSLIEILKNVDSTRLTGDIDTSLKEDKNFNGENKSLQSDVKSGIQASDKSLKAFIATLEKLTAQEKIATEDISKSYKEASADLYKFQLKAVDVLSEMLGSRISEIKANRAKSVGIGIFAVLIALIISYYITNTIKTELNGLIAKLSANSEQVESTSQQNMDISNELAQAVVEQASSVQEIAATTEEISQMTQRNNENVKVSMQATGKTVETVNSATQIINELSQTIDDVRVGNDEIIERSKLNSKSFESIIDIIKTIEDKTKVINDIVFQTKLLSFNASVEAARAGEQGKGFSVVAEEVGNLAQMSGGAAQEITELLDGSLKKVRELTIEADSEIKKVVDKSTNNIANVIEKVRHTENINVQILANSEKITLLFGEVVTASDEQTRGVIEITKVIGSFDVVTNRNSQLANDLSTSARSLSDKSNELREVIKSLTIMAGIGS